MKLVSILFFFALHGCCLLSAVAAATENKDQEEQDNDLLVMVIIPQAEELTSIDARRIEDAQDALSAANSKKTRGATASTTVSLGAPTWCASICRSWPFPFCQVWQRQCVGYRRRNRRLLDGSLETDDIKADHTSTRQRRLVEEPEYKLVVSQGVACDEKQKEILSVLENAVSDESKSIVMDSQMTCFEVVEVCEILRLALWNADTDSLVQTNMRDGAEICMEEFDFSVEAVADACVESVSFRVQGPNGYEYYHRENMAAYFLCKNTDVNVRPCADMVEEGTYTLTAIADDTVDNAVSVSFTLKSC